MGYLLGSVLKTKSMEKDNIWELGTNKALLDKWKQDQQE